MASVQEESPTRPESKSAGRKAAGLLARIITAPAREFRDHPRGLKVLFSAEMWERFSFYGMRAILVLYLVKALGMSRADALELSAIYVGLVYLTPLLGGYLADRYLGQFKVVLVGGLLMTAGHFAMAFPALLHFALGLLVLGNGFFKPSCSTMVGDLYPDGDRRKERAYTIFYMGINLGAFLSPLVCGTLGESEMFGWHWGFATAGIGMVVGLVTLLWNHRHVHQPPADRPNWCGLTAWGWSEVLVTALAFGAVAWVVVTGWSHIALIWSPGWTALQEDGGLLWGYRILLAVAAWACWTLAQRWLIGTDVRPETADEELTRVDWLCMAVIGVLSFFSVVLWTGLEQAGGTMTLFADEKTDMMALGWTLPASYFQSLNPLIIILFALPLSVFWGWLDGRYPISAAAKQGWGLIIAGLSFAVMAAAEQQAGYGVKVSPLWLTAVYALQTLGEMCSYPVGTALVNQISPRRYLSRMMAVWLAGSAVAGYLAGTLESRLQSIESILSLPQFLFLAMTGAGVVLLFLSPVLRRMCGGRM